MLWSTAASSGRVRRVGSFTGSGRSSGMHSGSEGVAVAPVTASAAMGSARARAGREAEEGTGSRGEEGRCRGRGEVRGVTRGLGEEAGGGQSGVEVARTAASRCPRPSGEEEDDRGVAVAGWAGQGGSWAGWWAARVRPGMSFSLLFLFCFIFFYFCNLFLICFKYEIIL